MGDISCFVVLDAGRSEAFGYTVRILQSSTCSGYICLFPRLWYKTWKKPFFCCNKHNNDDIVILNADYVATLFVAFWFAFHFLGME